MKKINYFLVISLFSLVTLHAFSLKDGFKYALENDVDSKVNENNLKNIKFDQDIADSLLYPKVDFSATVETKKTTQNKLTPGNGESLKNDEYKFKITQPIFDGYESKYEKELQKNRFNSAVYYLKESQNKVAIDYASAYVNTLREKDLLSLNNESLSISEDIFNKVNKKVSAGYGTKLEFEEAKGNVAENRVNFDIQRINFRDSLENLRFYVQRDFDSSELRKPAFSIKLPKTLDEAIKLSLENNPTINVTRANVEVAVAEERKKDKGFYPNLNFVASYTINDAFHSEPDQENNEFTVGLELNYNLYNGGKNTAESKKALQNIKDKQLLITKNQYQIKNKVRLAWNSYRLNKEKKESLEQYLIVKKDILDATLKEFDLGLKDLNTLLDTHIEYIDVKKDLISNSYDLLLAQYKILDATGQLSDVLLNKLPTLNNVNTSTVSNDLHNETLYSFNKTNNGKNKKLLKITPSVKKDFESFNTLNIPLQNTKAQVQKTSLTSFENNEESFKVKFLKASPNKYTVNLALSNSEKKAQRFLDKNKLNDRAFFFSFRKVDPLQKIMMGIYNSRKEAKEAISKLNKQLQKNNPTIEKIKIKQKLYHKYHGDDKIFKEQYIAKNEVQTLEKPYKIVKASFSNTYEPKTQVQKIEKKVLNIKYKSFKDRFLNATKDKYTINLAYSDSKKKAYHLLEKNGLENEGFVFQFRNERPLQRIVYGIFDTKAQAKKVLASLPKNLKINKPVVERISIKQKVFHKYNSYTFESNRLGSI